jgi:hypothetical protein
MLTVCLGRFSSIRPSVPVWHWAVVAHSCAKDPYTPSVCCMPAWMPMAEFVWWTRWVSPCHRGPRLRCNCYPGRIQSLSAWRSTLPLWDVRATIPSTRHNCVYWTTTWRVTMPIRMDLRPFAPRARCVPASECLCVCVCVCVCVCDREDSCHFHCFVFKCHFHFFVFKFHTSVSHNLTHGSHYFGTDCLFMPRCWSWHPSIPRSRSLVVPKHCGSRVMTLTRRIGFGRAASAIRPLCRHNSSIWTGTVTWSSIAVDEHYVMRFVFIFFFSFLFFLSMGMIMLDGKMDCINTLSRL